MNYRQLICRTFVIVSMSMIAFPAIAFEETRQDMNTWTYHKDWDNLNNRAFSLARSPLPKRGVYDNLRLDFVCRSGQLQFAVIAGSLITSQGRTFDFEYQVDDNNPVNLQMKTYPDSKRRGYTDRNVLGIVEDILSGNSIFIRIQTLIQTVLSAAMPLADAASPIGHVLADCGVKLPGTRSTLDSYSVADFERDLKTLTPERQRQVLDQIKALLQRER